MSDAERETVEVPGMDRIGGTTDVLTLGEMRDLLRQSARLVEEAERAYDEQARLWEYTEGRTDIGHEDGSGREEIRAALLKGQRPDYDQAARGAEGAAVAAEANVRELRKQVAGERVVLPPDLRAVAAQIAPLAERDAERLGLPQLAVELRGAIAAGDDALAYLYHRALPARLARPVDAASERPEDTAARAELGRLLLAVGEKLRDPVFDEVRAEADRVLENADALRARASRGRRRVSGAVPTTVDGQAKVAWPDRGAA